MVSASKIDDAIRSIKKKCPVERWGIFNASTVQAVNGAMGGRPKDPLRAAALDAGLMCYTSESPCKNCGGLERYSRNGVCRACATGKSGKRKRYEVLE